MKIMTKLLFFDASNKAFCFLMVIVFEKIIQGRCVLGVGEGEGVMQYLGYLPIYNGAVFYNKVKLNTLKFGIG